MGLLTTTLKSAIPIDASSTGCKPPKEVLHSFQVQGKPLEQPPQPSSGGPRGVGIYGGWYSHFSSRCTSCGTRRATPANMATNSIPVERWKEGPLFLVQSHRRLMETDSCSYILFRWCCSLRTGCRLTVALGLNSKGFTDSCCFAFSPAEISSYLHISMLQTWVLNVAPADLIYAAHLPVRERQAQVEGL